MMIQGLLGNRRRENDRAFTLIELLIVIAVIAILALIAIPNSLEAQTRSKIARAKADMRTVAAALESYYVDNNVYVMGYESRLAFDCQAGYPHIYCYMTTPIAYLTSFPSDPFVDSKAFQGVRSANNYTENFVHQLYPYRYETFSPMKKGNPFTKRMFQAYCNGYRWAMYSVGPRRLDLYRGLISYYGGGYPVTLTTDKDTVRYDPTNGTVSNGIIPRSNMNEQGLVVKQAHF